MLPSVSTKEYCTGLPDSSAWLLAPLGTLSTIFQKTHYRWGSTPTYPLAIDLTVTSNGVRLVPTYSILTQYVQIVQVHLHLPCESSGSTFAYQVSAIAIVPVGKFFGCIHTSLGPNRPMSPLFTMGAYMSTCESRPVSRFIDGLYWWHKNIDRYVALLITAAYDLGLFTWSWSIVSTPPTLCTWRSVRHYPALRSSLNFLHRYK